MPRTATKWLVAWYGPDGKFKDALERTMFIRPATWASKRCSKGETFQYWNISDPDTEKKIRAELDEQDLKLTIVETLVGRRYRCQLCKKLFEHKDIKYLEGDYGYTQLCEPCLQTPKAQCFLPYYERVSRGLVKSDEITNWNAFHDF